MLPAREVAAVVPENDAVYRRQLVEEMRMCVKGLVALCHQRQGDCLDDSTGQVDTLCLTMEKILRHGLKGPPPTLQHHNTAGRRWLWLTVGQTRATFSRRRTTSTS